MGPMSDRLTELQRQRALMQEHLDWLDQEIAAAGDRTTPARPAQPPAQTKPVFTVTPPASGQNAETILAQYQSDQQAMKKDVRKGCFLYFAGAFLMLVLAVWALYLYSRRLH